MCVLLGVRVLRARGSFCELKVCVVVVVNGVRGCVVVVVTGACWERG